MKQKNRPLFVALMGIVMVILMTFAIPQSVQAAGTLKLSKASATIYVNETTTIKPTVSGLSNKNVSYKSNKTSVATVDSKGKVTAKAKGTAKITVTAKGNKKLTKTFTVTVKQCVTKFTVPSTLTVDLKGTVKLTPSKLNSSAQNNKFTFTSNNNNVTITGNKSKSATIKGAKVGTSKITVKPLYGATAATTKTVTVTVRQPATGVSVSPSASSHTMYVGDTYDITVGTTPSNAYTKTCTVTTNDKSIVTVNNVATAKNATKVTLKACKAGTAKITITPTAGTGKKTITVTVKQQITGYNVPEALTLNLNKSYTLTPTKVTSNANDKKFKFKTGKSSVVSISSTSGTQTTLKAKKVGTTTITVQPNVRATAATTKTIAVTVVDLNSVKNDALTLAMKDNRNTTMTSIGATRTIVPSVSVSSTIPEGEYSYASSDSRVAMVNANGKVTAQDLIENYKKTKDTVTITCSYTMTTDDGSTKAISQSKDITVDLQNASGSDGESETFKVGVNTTALSYDIYTSDLTETPVNVSVDTLKAVYDDAVKLSSSQSVDDVWNLLNNNMAQLLGGNCKVSGNTKKVTVNGNTWTIVRSGNKVTVNTDEIVFNNIKSTGKGVFTSDITVTGQPSHQVTLTFSSKGIVATTDYKNIGEIFSLTKGSQYVIKMNYVLVDRLQKDAKLNLVSQYVINRYDK